MISGFNFIISNISDLLILLQARYLNDLYQLEVYSKVDRLLAGLTAQIVTTAQWYHRVFRMEASLQSLVLMLLFTKSNIVSGQLCQTEIFITYIVYRPKHLYNSKLRNLRKSRKRMLILVSHPPKQQLHILRRYCIMVKKNTDKDHFEVGC